MNGQEPVVLLILRYFIPAFFSMLLRICGLGAKNRFRAVTGMSMFTIYMTGVPYVLFHFMIYSEYQKIVSFVMFAGNLFVFYISSEGFLKTAFMHMCQANAVMVVSVLCNGLRHIFQLGYLELCVMEFIICLAGYLWARKFVVKSFRYTADYIRANWLLILIISMAEVISNIVIVTYFSTYFGDQPIRNMLVVLTQELLSMATRNMSERLFVMEENAKQSRRVNHDRRHFNNLLLELIEAGEVNEASIRTWKRAFGG